MSHRARRRFGQNFLVDDAVVADIVRAVSPRSGDRMAEIGPGLAALTRPLSRAVQPLHAVEIDRDIVARLRNEFEPERLIIHEGDALQFDFASLGPNLRVVGNLPYNISTPLLFHLASCAPALYDIHAMLQLEVVERIAAAPGSSEYGRLSVMLQYQFHIEKVLDVPASAFRPVPKVESAVIRMIPRTADELDAKSSELFAATVVAAFSQRRKTLRNTLGTLLSASDFDQLGLDPMARAQTLSVAQFVKIANYRADKADGSFATTNAQRAGR